MKKNRKKSFLTSYPTVFGQVTLNMTIYFLSQILQRINSKYIIFSLQISIHSYEMKRFSAVRILKQKNPVILMNALYEKQQFYVCPG